MKVGKRRPQAGQSYLVVLYGSRTDPGCFRSKSFENHFTVLWTGEMGVLWSPSFEILREIECKSSRRIHMKSQRLLGLSRITAACWLLIFVSLTPSPLAAQNGRSSIKNFQHVFIIMMENTGFDTLIGNPNAPFVNAAAANYGLASNYFGVTHPSQPNYIAATSGSTNGVASDNDTTINV